jgi:hypothetical protein
MSKATPIAIRPESPHSRSTPHASRITTPHQLPFTNYDSRRTPALLYLAFALLKGKSRQFLRNLRRPTTALGFGSLLFVFGILFHFRHETFFAELMRPATILGAVLIMLCGSLFKGFLQRGLVFELADIDFVFTSPFTSQQIVLYRLLPSYLYAALQSAAFFALFVSHLRHPWLVSLGLLSFQICCFQIAAGAAIFAGSISEDAHHRLKWMLLFSYFMIAALYLRYAWDLRLVPPFASSPLAQAFFYPSAPLIQLGTVPALEDWAMRLAAHQSFGAFSFVEPLACLILFAFAALLSLTLVFRLKADLFESSLVTTAAAAERRARLRQNQSLAVSLDLTTRSFPLPKLSFCHGMGALIWKNMVAALRSKRQLALAAFFALIYTGFLVALRCILQREMRAGGSLPQSELHEFDKGLGAMLILLAFFLQRAFPFDFRRDGRHLVQFRTLPLSPLAVVLAELSVPTFLCLLFQAGGVIIVSVLAKFDFLFGLLVILSFPAVAIALNAVWNLHYLLAATKHAGNRTETVSPMALLLVVALSFLIFYPAGWAAIEIGQHTRGPSSETKAIATWLVIQYAVDALLVFLLASLYQRFEVARDS